VIAVTTAKDELDKWRRVARAANLQFN